MIRNLHFWIVAPLILCGLCGCTVINIDGAKNATLLKSGVLKIEPADPDSTIAVNVTGFGLVPETRGATLGYSNAQIVMASPQSACRIFIFTLPEGPAEAEMWKNFIADNPAVCTMGETK